MCSPVCDRPTFVAFSAATVCTLVALQGVFSICTILKCSDVKVVAIAFTIANIAWINFFFLFYKSKLQAFIPKNNSSPNITPEDSPRRDQREGMSRSQELTASKAQEPGSSGS